MLIMKQYMNDQVSKATMSSFKASTIVDHQMTLFWLVEWFTVPNEKYEEIDEKAAEQRRASYFDKFPDASRAW